MTVLAPQVATAARSARLLGVPIAAWITGWIALVVVAGSIYAIRTGQDSAGDPKLPAPPPHATVLSPAASTTDMLQGNFITTSALYSSANSPAHVIAFYRSLLAAQRPLLANFAQTVDTTVYTRFPKDGPLGLQHLPPAFESPTAANKHAARFVFAEYHRGHDDISIAVDTRSATGPTLVYLEMLTSFS